MTSSPAAAAPVAAVLWDIDGTLLTAGSVAVQAFLDAVADVSGVRPSGRDLDLGGRIDPEIAATLLASVGADRELVPAVLRRLGELAIARTPEFTHRVQLLPGIRRTVGALHDRGIAQTVVTGNVETVARIKLHAAGLVPPIDPAVGGFGDSGATRAEVAQVALNRLSAAGRPAAPGQCWVVGDTPRDAACAAAVGVRCALVATGRHSAAELAEVGADVVIDGFHDPALLLRLWNM